jgi:hypothetical protein
MAFRTDMHRLGTQTHDTMLAILISLSLRCPALQNDHYYAYSMQKFLDMLTRRMYGSSSSSAIDNSTYQSEISKALTSLAAAGINISREELELLPARKKQVRCGQQQAAAATAVPVCGV